MIFGLFIHEWSLTPFHFCQENWNLVLAILRLVVHVNARGLISDASFLPWIPTTAEGPIYYEVENTMEMYSPWEISDNPNVDLGNRPNRVSYVGFAPAMINGLDEAVYGGQSENPASGVVTDTDDLYEEMVHHTSYI